VDCVVAAVDSCIRSLVGQTEYVYRMSNVEVGTSI
jgi:hypothetical protein